jgi:Uma2 family endonuclease
MARSMTLTYPTSDGKPMAETDWHRDLMVALIQVLQEFYADEAMVYVSGNLLVFYVPGDGRKHVSPDVFVVKGVAKHSRPNYLIWEEGKGPDLVIELTSSSTRAEDVKRKFVLYQDTLKVQEYFLFDPLGDYLKPALKGFRLQRGVYGPIRSVPPESGVGFAPGTARLGPSAVRSRQQRLARQTARRGSNSSGGPH